MPDLSCDIYHVGSAAVIATSGQVTFAEIEQFDAFLKRAVAGKPAKLILDFKELRLITSAGIGSLLKLYHEVNEWDCQLWIVGVQPGVEEIIRGSRLDQVLDLAKSVDEALAE